MPKSVFISYSRQQGEWVWDRLVPCLKAGGVEVLIDREQFEAARNLNRQMDEVQDRADLNILVFSPDYLTSKPCQREMKRAIQRDPEFQDGVSIPIKRLECDLPAAIRRPNPLHVDLRDDQKEDAWDLLFRSCEAVMGAPAPLWLKARDDIRLYLERGVSVNLVVQGKVEWRSLIDDLRRYSTLRNLTRVDLMSGATTSRKAFVEAILNACGIPSQIPARAAELVILSKNLESLSKAARVALTHFDRVKDREDFDNDLFSALRYEVTESRKLVLLIQSYAPFASLVPIDHPLSSISSNLNTVELKGRP